MKRGFLQGKALSKPASDRPHAVSHTGHTDKGKAEPLAPTPPFDIPAITISYRLDEPWLAPPPGGYDAKAVNYTITHIPEYSRTDEYCFALVYPGVKEALSTISGFPRAMPIASSPLPYRIVPTPSMGKGMFASRDIRAGELIACERPLVVTPATFPSLEGRENDVITAIVEQKMKAQPEKQKAFYDLFNCKKSGKDVKNILDTNALWGGALPGPYSGGMSIVHLDISRINHSCVPNAHHYFDLPSFSSSVRALVPIAKGEQIFIHYVGDHYSRSQRIKDLSDKYAFTCTCPACSLPTTKSKLSDTARSRLGAAAAEEEFKKDDTELTAWVSDPSLPDDHIIQQSKTLVDVMEGEGLFMENIWRFHFPRLCKAYCALGDLGSAKEWAKKTSVLVTAYTGNDGGWEKVYRNPENTTWWKTRRTVSL